MSYKALYRRWRPDTFDRIIGQDAVVKTLKNQVMSGRTGHAYLFCGTRGTGKTSAAKILARAVNCPEAASSGGNPCNACSMCRSILDGSSMNVIEIDAASNNGVDNIRDIRAETEYPPVDGRFRVYIIDEVHMLSAGAFNALLKTLEEPPSYVIFILATTDPQKVPATILSRCQRYDFRRIASGSIYGQLSAIAESEGLAIEERALRYIAQAGDGSMRDALSVLEQCVSYSREGTLTYEDVLKILGAADTAVYSRLLGEISGGDVSAALLTLGELISSGADIMQITADLIWYTRNVLLAGSISKGSEDILNISADTLRMASEDVRRISRQKLISILGSLAELMNRARFSAQKRVLLEVELIRLCTADTVQAASGNRTERRGGAAAGEGAVTGISANASGPGPVATAPERARPRRDDASGAALPPWEESSAESPEGTPEAPYRAAGDPPRKNAEGDGAPGKGMEKAGKALPLKKAVQPAPGSGDACPGSGTAADIEILGRNWDALVAGLHPSNRPLFAGAVLTQERGMPVILFKSGMNYKLAAGNIEENGVLKLRELSAALLGHDIKLMARPARAGEIKAVSQKITDEELARINFHIDIED